MKRLTDLIILFAIDLLTKHIWMDTYQNIEQCEYFKEWILLKTAVVLLLKIFFYGYGHIIIMKIIPKRDKNNFCIVS